MRNLKELVEEYSLTTTNDGRIFILILEPPESVFCPLSADDIAKCVIVTQAEFEDLINGGGGNLNHQFELLTKWKAERSTS